MIKAFILFLRELFGSRYMMDEYFFDRRQQSE